MPLKRTNIMPILVSLVGILLTHGIALACIVYCALINPLNPLIGHHHHHHAQHVMLDPTQRTIQMPPLSSGVLEQGSQVPFAINLISMIVLVLGIVRLVSRITHAQFASWIMPPQLPPPRPTLVVH